MTAQEWCQNDLAPTGATSFMVDPHSVEWRLHEELSLTRYMYIFNLDAVSMNYDCCWQLEMNLRKWVCRLNRFTNVQNSGYPSRTLHQAIEILPLVLGWFERTAAGKNWLHILQEESRAYENSVSQVCCLNFLVHASTLPFYGKSTTFDLTNARVSSLYTMQIYFLENRHPGFCHQRKHCKQCAIVL